jgi:hypothetical protein
VQGQFQHVVRDRFVGVGDGVGEAAGDFLQARHFIRGVAAALGQAVLVAGVAAGLLSFRMAFRKTFLARAFADRFDFLEGRQRDGRRGGRKRRCRRLRRRSGRPGRLRLLRRLALGHGARALVAEGGHLPALVCGLKFFRHKP